MDEPETMADLVALIPVEGDTTRVGRWIATNAGVWLAPEDDAGRVLK